MSRHASEDRRWVMEPIGWLRSCYHEKFAVPRQPGLAPAATAQLVLVAPYNHPDCVAGLEAYSHLWLTFVFHQTQAQGWKPKVRPPRLGGNQKVGVFASRSTFRPNGLGLSVVRLERIEQGEKLVLHLSGVDLIDGTPILDIKPYLPWSDAHPEAQAAWAPNAPTSLAVRFSLSVQAQLAVHPEGAWLEQLLIQVLSQDPKPAYQKPQPERLYGVALAQHNVRFRYLNAETLEIVELQPLD